MLWAQVIPVFDPRVRIQCRRPYPLHPHGCPNYGKVDRCPPKVCLLDERFDLNAPCFVIWNVFPLGEHVAKLRAAHPEWSERQLECCLYWQGTARRQLGTNLALFRVAHPGYEVTTCPEAMGLNVTETMKLVGVTLEWPPKEIAIQVAFAGVKRT